MQSRYREKRNDQEHDEKVSVFHLAKFWMFFLLLFLKKCPLRFPCCLLCYLLRKEKVQTVVHRCSPKQVLLKTSQYSQEKTCVEASFWEGFRTEGPTFLFKKRLQRRCFFCEYCKIFKSSVFIEDLFIIPL